MNFSELNNCPYCKETAKKQQETAQLLDITTAISQITDRAGLFQNIFQKIGPLFGCTEFALFVVDKNGTHYRMWENNLSFRYCEGEASKMGPGIPIDGNAVIQECLLDEPPRVYNREAMLTTAAAEPAIRNWVEGSRSQETLVGTLKYGGKVLGCLNAMSTTSGTFSEDKICMYSNICDLVAIAVANIIANDQIKQREQENATLLAISEAIATIRDRAELFEVILGKVIPEINAIPTVSIFTLTPAGKHYRVWLAHNESPAVEDLIEDSGSWEFEVESDPMAKDFLFDTSFAFIRDQQYFVEKYPGHPSLEITRLNQVSQSLVIPLRIGGTNIGCMSFNTTGTSAFYEEKLDFYQSLGNQIALAVANVTANEEILRREKEKSLLLSLSEDIAAIRDKHDLWKVVMGKVKNVLPFNESPHIAVINPDGKSMRILMIDPGESVQNNKDYRENAVESFALEDSPYELCLQAEIPTVYSLEYALQHYPDYWGTKIWLATGILESLTVQLKHAGKIIGSFFVHSTNRGSFSPAHFGLFKSVADQIATAVANILANEQILEREKEKALLLSLSEQMAAIRNRDDLYAAMMSKLKPIAGFDDAVVVIFSKDQQQYKHFLTASPLERRTNQHYEQIVDRWLPVKNTPNEYLLTLDSPYEWQIDDLMTLYPDYPGCLLCKQTGLNHCVGFRMHWGGEFIGLFQLAFGNREKLRPDRFHLYKTISEQVGISVSNILANEEVAEREKENLVMLKISQQLAAAGSIRASMNVIFEELHKACQFDDVVLVLTDPERQYIQHVGNYAKSEFRKLSNPFYRKVMTEKIAVKGTPYEEYFALKIPQIYAVQEFLGSRYPDYIGLRIIKLFAIQESLYIPLINNQKLFGTLEIHNKEKGRFDPAKISILENVANQLTVSIANILSREQILEREKEKTVLLDISEGLAAVKTREDLLTLITHRIKPLFNYNGMNIFILSEKNTKFRAWYDQLTENKPWEQLFGPTQKGMRVNESIIANTLFEDRKPFIVDRARLLRLYKNSSGFPQLKQSTISSIMLGPLKVGGRVIGSFNLLSTGDHLFSVPMLAMFQNITDQLAVTVANIMANEEIIQLNKQLKLENTYLLEEVSSDYNPEEFVGQSKIMREVYGNIGLVAKTDTTVLILGETGTGKELVARAIHNLSGRKNKPLIKINCAALPANLIESELFGHERGAFTGAIERRIGKFELATGSTLFLDEVGELPLELQAKLLRAIQEKEIERLGSNKIIKTDVRILAATNRNLAKEVKEGKFRPDLYYRLNVFPVSLPALRERKEDIPLLANHLIQKAARNLGKMISGISNEAMEQMIAYEWPGNIREMEHVMERAVLLAKGRLLVNIFLPEVLQQTTLTNIREYAIKPYEEQERDYLLFVLQKCSWKLHGPTGAAAVLQLPPSTLQSKMLRLGIRRKHFAVGTREGS